MKCEGCGHEEFSYIEKTFSNGSKHYERWCKKCGVFNKYAPKTEVDPNAYENENLADFVMPFGKYKDMTLQNIAEQDYDYLLWASENVTSTGIKERIKQFIYPIRLVVSQGEFDNG